MYIPLAGCFLGSTDANFKYKDLGIKIKMLEELQRKDAPQELSEILEQAVQMSFGSLIDDRNNKSTTRKSLIEFFIGKQGLLRKNILAKRNDYTGRTVIVPDPSLKIGQCRLPFKMCKDLLSVQIKKVLLQKGFAKNIFEADKLLHSPQGDKLVRKLLEEEMLKSACFSINRAPTLHRVSTQSFIPLLQPTDDIYCIGLFPLNCKAFNADFDGDQMGVHISLTVEDTVESIFLMNTRFNLFEILNGNCLLKPNRTVTLGIYYSTLKLHNKFYTKNVYTILDILVLHELKKVKDHDNIKIL